MRAALEQKMRGKSNGRTTTDCQSPYSDCPKIHFTIPVVFHVVRNQANDPEVYDSEIYAAIEELNQYYSGTHPDHSGINPIFSSVFAGDTQIKFVLATVDPWGNTHSGIIRKNTQNPIFLGRDPKNATGTAEVFYLTDPCIKRENEGGSAAWPHTKYLNIWVGNFNAPARGFATFPIDDIIFPQFSGIVVRPQVIKETTFSSVPMNRTTVAHEIGHWLNLLHTFTDDCLDGCDYLIGDFCKDTPRDDTGGPAFLCAGDNRCTESPVDLPDMDENMMDYAAPCRSIFTKDQADRMRCAASSRSGEFWGSGGCIAQLSNPNVIMPNGSICFGTNTTLTAALYPDISYTWILETSVPDINMTTSGNTATIFNYNPSYFGQVKIKLQMASTLQPGINCGTSRFYEYNLWVGTPNTAPTIVVQNPKLGTTYDMCKDLSIIRVTAPLPIGTTYEWNIKRPGSGAPEYVVIDGAEIDAITHFSSFGSGTGHFHVRARQLNNCGYSPYSITLQIRIQRCGRPPGSGERYASLTPNPAQSQVTVKVAEEVAIAQGGLDIRIKDMFGLEKLAVQSQTRETTLNISSLQAGIYIVYVQNGANIEYLRLNVE